MCCNTILLLHLYHTHLELKKTEEYVETYFIDFG